MLFNSFHFLIFIPIVFFLYYFLPYKLRNILLLVASVYFYAAWIPKYILVIIFSVTIDFISARLIAKINNPVKRKILLIISLISNIGILAYFKYFNFFVDSFVNLSQLGGVDLNLPFLEIILPIGISFHTFQAMGYVIDVYRGKIPPERNIFKYFIFILFFPQLVAGPIERASNLLKQFDEHHDFDYRGVTDGLKLAAWGMFKKIVIADRLAVFVDYVYQSPSHFTGMPLIIATVFFAFQIYCDFSGYTDIALGTAKMFGFELTQNFKRPYFSKSVSEFWTRWHISLSTWFRDYVYFSLGGNRVIYLKWCRNILIVFLVSGLWHGANWTYVIWGGLNGLYMLISSWTKSSRQKIAEFIGLLKFPKIHLALQIIFTFTLTCLAWVFFRAGTLKDAFYILSHSMIGVGQWLYNIFTLNYAYIKQNVYLGQNRTDFIIAVVFIFLLLIVEYKQELLGSLRNTISGYHWALRWLIYVIFLMVLILFGNLGQRQFIYFVF